MTFNVDKIKALSSPDIPHYHYCKVCKRVKSFGIKNQFYKLAKLKCGKCGQIINLRLSKGYWVEVTK